ncbi:hypothetical protein [Brevibacterium casei]|uniref:hypothetical protein n=2 Tax=Brevibacterium casei TaxID=33889 RepID=UPI0011A04836|nr:hypothetical protein [Brevibacterium casei]
MRDFILLPRLEPLIAEQRRSSVQSFDHGRELFSTADFHEALEDPHAFPATGGRQVDPTELLALRERCLHAAESAETQDRTRFAQSFDIRIGRILYEFGMESVSDMGHPRVWDFLTLVLLPDIAIKRVSVGKTVEEIAQTSSASRLTGGDRRHVLQRLWRRWKVFGPELVERQGLTEDDYVALLERRLTLGQSRVAMTAAETILGSSFTGSARREYTRILMRNLIALSGVIHIGDDDPQHLEEVFKHLHEQTLEMM